MDLCSVDLPRRSALMAWMELSAIIVFLGAAWNAESATRLPWNFAIDPRTIHE
jgi:uncharacterized BrkB/YihY/UPF0761 family membrane protein